MWKNTNARQFRHTVQQHYTLRSLTPRNLYLTVISVVVSALIRPAMFKIKIMHNNIVE